MTLSLASALWSMHSGDAMPLAAVSFSEAVIGLLAVLFLAVWVGVIVLLFRRR